jgi:alkylated DNA repair dioxygenase AlkB
MDNSLPEKIPEGFEYYPDFISFEEEHDLLNFISGIEFQTFVFQGYTAKRKVASFGLNYSFDSRMVSEGKPIPSEFRSLINKAAGFVQVPPGAFEEALIIEYPEGAVINWHRDAPPFDIIAGISLLSDCRFRLRPQDKILQTRNSVIAFTVKRRSLYIMKGAARSEWQHSIATVKEKRYSITLRTMRKRD